MLSTGVLHENNDHMYGSRKCCTKGRNKLHITCTNSLWLQVSHELADVSRDADLVILEGMGRGIETNLFAQLTCVRPHLPVFVIL